MPRRALKRAVEMILARGGPASLAARLSARSTLILAYHNIVPDDAPRMGEFTLHLPLARFRTQLDYLQATHDLVDLASIRERRGTSERPRAAITIDDAYRGAILHGIPELAARGIPATIFVAPGILGSDGCWWDVLASTDGRGLDRAIRGRAVDALRGNSAAVFAWASSAGCALPALPSYAGIATEEELNMATQATGIRLAPHTWTHCNLEYLAESEFDRELLVPLRWLQERFERVLPWLAYPYGAFGPGTASVVHRAGYTKALKIDGGWVRDSALSDFVLPRFNVNSDLSIEGFMLRASGLIAP